MRSAIKISRVQDKENEPTMEKEKKQMQIRRVSQEGAVLQRVRESVLGGRRDQLSQVFHLMDTETGPLDSAMWRLSVALVREIFVT